VGYFNFEFNRELVTSLVHCLNRPYKGARKLSATGPDARGPLIVSARNPHQCI
jgi:hypothetical protein